MYLIDNEMHDGLGNEVFDGLRDDSHVRINQITNCLHLQFI